MLSGGPDELSVAKIGLLEEPACRREHRVDRIGEHDAKNSWRECESRVAGAAANIEDAFISRRRRELDDKLELST